MTLDYQQFLATKAKAAAPVGFEPSAKLCKALKPFQRDLVTVGLRRGRSALFSGTGTGKTLKQLSWADEVERHAGGQILVLAPLAVAEQTVQEAVKFDIPGVAYAERQADATSRIVVTNYERLELFDTSKFVGVVPDESSIIKAHDSKTRGLMIEAFARTPFKLPCSATPAPNDWIELGNHAEFLGVMTEKEMLSMYFVHDGSMRANSNGEWRLKGHAESQFWEWVASWATMINHPRDLGYDEPGYDLPPLHLHQVTVDAASDISAGHLVADEAQTLQERQAARRDSIGERVEAAAKIVNGQPGKPWLVWCHLNAEADALMKAIPGAVEVRGTDKPEDKKKRLMGFTRGEFSILVTKPSIAGWGMNWQHCRDEVFVGLNDSFEQLYHAIRRCWRFGQTEAVNAYLIASRREGAVVKNLQSKERAHEAMLAGMAKHMNEILGRDVRQPLFRSAYSPKKTMELPQWLAA